MKLRVVLLSLATLVVFVAAAAPARAQHAQYYLLDGYGGVHSGDGAPIIASAPYFGWDIARDIVYVPVGTPSSTGDGVLVLDGFGGVHAAGALGADPPGTSPPYFGFDIARGITYRDVPPRIATASSPNFLDITTASPTFTTLASLTIYAPVNGFLHIVGTSYMSCLAPGANNDLVARLSANVDATTDGAPDFMGLATWTDCSWAGASNYRPTQNQTVSFAVSVLAGQHTVNLLGRKLDGTGTLRFIGRSVTAQFIASDFQGDPLGAVVPTTMPAPDESLVRVMR